MDVVSLWSHTRCHDLVKNQKVILIDSDKSIEEACELLAEKSIGSLPVYDKEHECHVGFFDYGDMVAFLLMILGQKKEHLWRVHEKENDERALRDILKEAAEHESISVRVVSDLSQRDPFYALLPESSILQAVEVFGKGIHRVAIVDNCGHLEGVLTQSGIVKFVSGHMDSLGAYANVKVEKFKSGSNYVMTAHSEDIVLDVLNLMNEHGLSSVPLVNKEGKIITTLSLSDVKYIFQTKAFSQLNMPCLEFLAISRDRFLENSRNQPPIYHVDRNATLKEVIDKLVAVKGRLLWIVDHDQRPVGVVTMTDILRFLTPLEK